MKISKISLVAVVSIVALLSGLSFWTDRNIDYVATWIAGEPANCPLWLSTIATFVFNGLVVPFNIIVEIIRAVR